MAKIDWDYARKADLWEHEEACKYVCPEDPSDRAKLDSLARVAAHEKKLLPRPIRRRRPLPDGFAYPPPDFLAFAQSKGFTIHPELAGIASPHPADGAPHETQPSAAPDNEPIAKRRAPGKFVAALIRLLVEISKRAAENGKPFDVNEMPGTKADFRELAIQFNGSRFNKAPTTFSDYLDGLLQFKGEAQKTTFYRELFPELFT